jgi:hypothetical protein
MKGIGLRIQDLLRQSLKKEDGQKCSMFMQPVVYYLWEMIVDSFNLFTTLDIHTKTVQQNTITYFKISSPEHLIAMEAFFGKNWWKIEHILQNEDKSKEFLVDTLGVSFFIQTHCTKSGAMRSPISFEYNKSKVVLKITMAIYYETEQGDITRGAKENHYSAAVTFRKNTKEEQAIQDAFLAD